MSELKVDKVSPRSGTALEIGDSGDIITLPAGSVTEKGADIASATTLVIGTDGDYFDITGTTAITGMTVTAGRRFTLQFDGIVTITDNAAITLSGAANFTTAAGDILSFIATAANTVVQTGYSLVDGGSPVAPSGGSWTHIETITPSAAATATFSHPSLSTTYRDYAIYMADIFAASSSKYFRMQIGTGSSVTWKTSGYYSSCDYRWATDATYWREDANNANSYIIAGDSAGSSTAGCGMSGVLYLFDRTNDYVGWRSSFVNNWQSAYPGWCNAAGHAGQSNITNVRFLWESDVNFVANGYMALYGRVLP